jgi:hypothetical protein
MSETAIELNSVWHSREAKDTSAGRKEVSSIVVGMEANEVTVQNAVENLAPDG